MYYALGDKTGDLYELGPIKSRVKEFGERGADAKGETVTVYSRADIKAMTKCVGTLIGGAHVD